jgi:LPS-assembly protein
MLPVSRPVPALSPCRDSLRNTLHPGQTVRSWLRGGAIRPLASVLASCLALASAGSAMAAELGPPGAVNTLFPHGLGDPIRTGADLGPALPSIAPSNSPTADAGPVAFQADSAQYDDQTQILTATGSVFLQRQDQSVRADTVTWNRKTGKILATGNVRMVDKDGNQLFTNQVELTDQFDVGAMQSMLLALREGGRLAADSGQRDAQGRVFLSHAAYTGCAVVNSKGCDVKPSWRIDARRVLYDPNRKLMRFYGARLILFGLKLPALPVAVTIASDGRAVGGLLIPNFRISAANGAEFSETYYQRFGNNKDIAATAYVFSKVAPMAEVEWRQLTGAGAYQITGYATSSSRIPVGGTAAGATGSGVTTGNAQTAFRGYIDANGQFQLSPQWDVNFSGRVASDRTFLARYQISGDDELRSTVKVEHIDTDSYFSIAGWAFQTLRTAESQGLVPIALPEIDYRRRIADPLLGGVITLQANSLAITRSAGQDTQRAFATARWDLQRITPLGQVVTLTALATGAAYHSSYNYLTTTSVYQGLSGWQTRASATAAVDVTWPFVGSAFGGTQVITPHVQVVATPPTKYVTIPNEDSRAVELEDDNLFALNRFPGYDRIEDGGRVTYGFDYQMDRPGLRATANLGQSYRFTSDDTPLPPGTGLSDRFSDYVGRVEVRYRDFITFTERFRVDHSSFAVHRNEVDATVGSERTYFELGYLRLNRQTATSLEDLADSNELRAAARVAIGPYWSAFGSGVFDLSQSNLLPGQPNAAFQPLRTRLGVSYKSDCLELDFTYRRDYITIGDAVQGSSFMLHLSLKHLGLR